ncbi:hypothetical protein [Peribacillus saganii]|uniref:hypothetical protein n=1 Tax=Peribacillus saganii TaxID=2303992 RepID=UPI0018F15196|nr:hypothetical protein [Peribacillus saganii]
MGTYIQDSSGIHSLNGFSYQIKVFVYYMLTLKEGMQIEFETIDDVNIKKINANEIDNYEDNFVNKIVVENVNTAIQVKRTSITEEVASKVLLNWILLESSNNIVSKYILFTDADYGNEDLMFSKTAIEQFTRINESTKNTRATISKVKSIYKDKYEEFEKIYLSIKNKYEFVSLKDIDQRIVDRCSLLFRKAGVNEVVYYLRIKELLQHVTVQVMESINDKKPNICCYDEFITLVEDISIRITETITQPLYADFKKLHTVDFNDLEVANSREYKQLLACKLPPVLVKQHLGFGAYYESLRFMFLESNKLGKIQNIEETTYENFESAKFSLKVKGIDQPYNRLVETKKLSNGYAENEQIRYGSGIYLTKDGVEDIQISWEDEENEKSET